MCGQDTQAETMPRSELLKEEAACAEKIKDLSDLGVWEFAYTKYKSIFTCKRIFQQKYHADGCLKKQKHPIVPYVYVYIENYGEIIRAHAERDAERLPNVQDEDPRGCQNIQHTSRSTYT